MVQLTLAEAIRKAIDEEMEANESIILMGEDVGAHGGVHGVTKGLLEKYGPARVIDTPISEIGIVGAGIGAAMMGLRPIVEIMYLDFLSIAMEQITNHGAQAHFLSFSKLKVPLVIRTQFSLGRQHGPQHSQFYLSALVNVPGINVALSSTPRSAYGLMKSALRQDKLTIFIDSAWEYFRLKEDVPDDRSFTIPFGKAEVLAEGSDISIITYSRTVAVALSALKQLKSLGISAEVVDMHTVSPLDIETPLKSVQKTGAGIVVSDEHEPASVASYIAQKLNELLYAKIKRPVTTLTSPFTFTPFSPKLEKEYMVDDKKIIGKALEVIKQ